MNKQKNKILFIFLRYLLIILLILSSSWIYEIFNYPTLRLTYFSLNLFDDIITISPNIFLFDGNYIELTSSCISPYAYLLFFILILSCSNISLKKIIFLFITCSITFLLINVSRSVLLAILINNQLFSLVHYFLWHFLSTIIVILIWFFYSYLFKIKSVPFYSDLNYLYNLFYLSKKNK